MPVMARAKRKKKPKRARSQNRSGFGTEVTHSFVPVRPTWIGATAFFATFGVLWVGSLIGLMRLQLEIDGTGSHGRPWVALPLVLDLIFTPVCTLCWCYAPVSRAIRVQDGALDYHVPGRFGGAYLRPERPRLFITLRRTLIVWSRWGPRLLPRFLQRADGVTQELVMDNALFVTRSLK
jgi:hypothetical protein